MRRRETTAPQAVAVFIILGQLFIGYGCNSSKSNPRLRQASSVLNVKTQKAAGNFWAATRDKDKVRIADEAAPYICV